MVITRSPPKNVNPDAPTFSCGKCPEADEGPMVQCDRCDKWFHFTCVGVTLAIQNKEWNCDDCKTAPVDEAFTTNNKDETTIPQGSTTQDESLTVDSNRNQGSKSSLETIKKKGHQGTSLLNNTSRRSSNVSLISNASSIARRTLRNLKKLEDMKALEEQQLEFEKQQAEKKAAREKQQAEKEAAREKQQEEIEAAIQKKQLDSIKKYMDEKYNLMDQLDEIGADDEIQKTLMENATESNKKVEQWIKSRSQVETIKNPTYDMKRFQPELLDCSDNESEFSYTDPRSRIFPNDPVFKYTQHNNYRSQITAPEDNQERKLETSKKVILSKNINIESSVTNLDDYRNPFGLGHHSRYFDTQPEKSKCSNSILKINKDDKTATSQDIQRRTGIIVFKSDGLENVKYLKKDPVYHPEVKEKYMKGILMNNIQKI